MKNGSYTLLVAPKEYPGKKYRGRYAYEHHIVYWKHHGIVPKKTEVIHHTNENKRDNCIENLELISKLDHDDHHKKRYCAVYLCDWCSKWKQTRLSSFRQKLKEGQEHFFCSQKCQAKLQWKLGGSLRSGGTSRRIGLLSRRTERCL